MKQIELFANGNARVHYHPLPYIPRKTYTRTKRQKSNEFMKVCEYNKNKKRAMKKFLGLEINPKNCMFITLTVASKEYNSVELINKKFKKLKDKIKITTKCEFVVIKVLEIQPNTKNIHIHAILQFSRNSRTIRKLITTEWLTVNWELGSQCSCTPVYDVISLFEYLIKKSERNLVCFDEDKDLDYNVRRTLFKKGTHAITISPNFPKSNKLDITCTDEDYKMFKEQTTYKQLSIQSHNYNNKNCIDFENLQLDLEGENLINFVAKKFNKQL